MPDGKGELWWFGEWSFAEFCTSKCVGNSEPHPKYGRINAGQRHVGSHVLVLTKAKSSVYTHPKPLNLNFGFLQSITLLIGGMTESNEQSNFPTNLAPPVAPGEYLLNKAKIAEAKALISAYEEMNEAGKQSHDELSRELEQKIREGEQARYVSTLSFQYNAVYVFTPNRELLLQLRSQSVLIPTVPLL